MREERGPIDGNALQTVERVFRKRLNGLIKDIEYVPNTIEAVELRITLYSGFNTDISWFDVQWWSNHGYKYHYVDDELEFRFGWEIRPVHPDKHFHPPEDITEHRKSCITHETPELVTLAVLKCWWDALQAGDLSV
jgi:hypothetical protein